MGMTEVLAGTPAPAWLDAAASARLERRGAVQGGGGAVAIGDRRRDRRPSRRPGRVGARRAWRLCLLARRWRLATLDGLRPGVPDRPRAVARPAGRGCAADAEPAGRAR